MQTRPFQLLLESPRRPLIMGILNVTPDSFSDGGEFLCGEVAVEHALTMLDEGADVIDIGGVSTRPPGSDYGKGAQVVSEAEEADRVLPVIEAILKSEPEAILSVDTTRSTIAARALHLGASVINDVSAGTCDHDMFKVVARSKASLILMHGFGPRFSKRDVAEYRYLDVVRETYEYLELRIRLAREAGIESVLADVGIGFAKGFEDNLRLIREHGAFEELGVPLVFGASRKSSIGKALRHPSSPEERVAASVAAALFAASQGATMLRVHDVIETRDALDLMEAIHRS